MRSVIAALTLIVAVAGTTESGEVRGAVEAGIGQSTWSGVGEGFAARTSFRLGGDVSLWVSERLSLRTGVAFARKGTQIPADPETITVDYLEVPLLLEVGPRRGTRIRPILMAGVAPAIRLRASSSQFPDLESGRFYETLDLNVVGGIGLEIDSRVAVEAKYESGLLRTRKGLDDSRSHAWILSLRWLTRGQTR
jgi:hypothetical protein